MKHGSQSSDRRRQRHRARLVEYRVDRWWPGLALALKHQPQIICIAREQVEDGSGVAAQLRAALPKSLIFMVSGAIDAATIESSLALGLNGFIVKPFKADAVLKSIRTAVLALVRKQQDATGG
jgi:two-component system chemotaxis response regulator CheY